MTQTTFLFDTFILLYMAAAIVTALEGSISCFVRSNAKNIACLILFSLTKTISSIYLWMIGNVTSPGWLVRNPSAIDVVSSIDVISHFCKFIYISFHILYFTYILFSYSFIC